MTRNKNATRYYSSRQERAVAKAIGGKQVANSGAGRWCAGDVRTKNFLIECKTCTERKNTFTMHKDWFDKNKEEAFAMHKDYSALAFDFGDGETLYVIDEHLFQQLLHYLEGEQT